MVPGMSERDNRGVELRRLDLLAWVEQERLSAGCHVPDLTARPRRRVRPTAALRALRPALGTIVGAIVPRTVDVAGRGGDGI